MSLRRILSHSQEKLLGAKVNRDYEAGENVTAQGQCNAIPLRFFFIPIVADSNPCLLVNLLLRLLPPPFACPLPCGFIQKKEMTY